MIRTRCPGSLLLGFLALAACGGLEPQEEQMLVIHKQNSKTYYDAGDLGRAEQQCRLGLDLSPSDRTLKLTLAYVRVRQGTKEALDEAENLLAGLGGARSEDYRIHLGRGLVHVARFRAAEAPQDGQPDPEAARSLRLARQSMERTLDLEPDCTEAAFQAALLALEEDDQEAFRRHAETTITLVERSVKAKTLALERVDRPDQRRLLQRDRWLDANRGRELLLMCAEQDWEDGQHAAALAHMDRLSELGEMGRADFFNRARILELLGEWQRAAKDYEKFIALSAGSDDPQVQTALESLMVIRAKLAETRTGDGPGGP